jgi:dTDP-4-dehydrorhamnose reductase
MKILLTGGSGQLGQELLHSLRHAGELVAPGRAAMDLADLDQVRDVVRAVRPDLIVNAAACTAVDRAEGEPALAHRVNGAAPAVMASEAARLGAAILHFSTDYVFDGGQRRPYVESDRPTPCNVYGHSKLAAETAVAASGARHLILRTGWLYGSSGHNFLRTMLALAQRGAPLRVVADQVGTPTWTRTVAAAAAMIVGHLPQADERWWQSHGGLYHVACQGETSWHGFAQAIMDHAALPVRVEAIASADYPQAARRPPYSVLCSDKWQTAFGPLPHWENALIQCLS